MPVVRATIRVQRRRFSMLTNGVAVLSHKGGIGKTTVSVQFAGYLAAQGIRVLLVDLDGNGNATLSLNRLVDAETGERQYEGDEGESLMRALRLLNNEFTDGAEKAAAAARAKLTVIEARENLGLIAGGSELGGLATALAADNSMLLGALLEFVAKSDAYNVVVVDAQNEALVCAAVLRTASNVILPVDKGDLSADAGRRLANDLKKAQMVREEAGREALNVIPLVWRVQNRSQYQRAVEASSRLIPDAEFLQHWCMDRDPISQLPHFGLLLGEADDVFARRDQVQSFNNGRAEIEKMFGELAMRVFRKNG